MNMTKIVLIVLVVAVLAGGGGYYLGMSGFGLSTASKTDTSSETVNPFATDSASTNPFDYENPFTNVKGISTEYVNPFDGLDQFDYRSPKTKGKIAY